MNVTELVNRIKEVALSQQTVNSVFDGDVYENWNSAEVNYGSVNVGIQDISTEDNLTTYNVILYYADRLLQDKSNLNEVCGDGFNTLQSIINILNSMDYINIEAPVTYTLFDQQFMDYLAGVYCQINITTDSPIGNCSMDSYDFIDDKDKLIEKLIEEINKYKTEDAELSVLLQSILYKISGETNE